jgi:N-formylmaleamate deformylase
MLTSKMGLSIIGTSKGRCPMGNWSSGYIDTNGIKMHYWRTGGGKPSVVLCHGFSDIGLCWKRVAQVLETHYDVIMMDARGHGLSDAPESGYADSDHAADVAGVIEVLKLNKPAVMGHSMGAATAAAVAVDYPDRLTCAVLVDPPWRSESQGGLGSAHRETIRTNMLEHKTRTPQQLLDWGRKEHPGWDEIEFDSWLKGKQQFNLNVLNFLGQFRDWGSAVDGIQCPAMVITADTSKGALVDDMVAREIRSRNQGVEVVHVEGAGHSIHRERFEPFMEAVQKFLTEHFAK